MTTWLLPDFHPKSAKPTLAQQIAFESETLECGCSLCQKKNLSGGHFARLNVSQVAYPHELWMVKNLFSVVLKVRFVVLCKIWAW